MRASAPANLLLLGEYAVTEEGGLGLALACAPRVVVEAEPRGSGGLHIEGLMGGAPFVWTEDEPGGQSLLVALAAAARAHPGREPPGLLARVDSSAFFGPDGAKLGLGSSAAVAVALGAVLLRARGLVGQALEDAIFPLALQAHRLAQGGRGSGYDVAASRFGGLGLFRGGREPSWRALESAAVPRLFLVAGGGPVASAGAVARYKAASDADPAWAAGFLADSNAGVRGFLEARDDTARLEVLRRAASRGQALGERIGVSARLDPPELAGLSGALSALKAVGAGDELGALAVSGEAAEACVARGLRELRVEARGLAWD